MQGSSKVNYWSPKESRWFETDDPFVYGGCEYESLDPKSDFQNVVIAPERAAELREWLARNGYEIEFDLKIKYPVKVYSLLFGEPVDKVNIGARIIKSDKRIRIQNL